MLDAGVPRTWHLTADENGAFDIADAPRSGDAILRTMAAGYATDSRPLPDFGGRASPCFGSVLDLDECHEEVRGQVLATTNEPVPGVQVVVGTAMQTATSPFPTAPFRY